MSNHLFYSSLGKLLYAVAISDTTISDTEKKIITKLIRERLIQKETKTDALGTNEAWFTDFAFETAEEASLSEEDAFDEFVAYAESYKHILSDEEIQLCQTLSNELADSYRHINKKEHRILNELRTFLINLQASQLIF
jgi:uncharacterized protein YpuA (DUF1002 family)